MEKRVVVFLIVSLLIIFGWNYALEKMGMVPVPPETEELQQAEPGAAPAEGLREGVVGEPKVSAREEKESAIAETMGEETALASSAEQTIEVVTDLYRAELSNRGGVITSWELTQYAATLEEASPPVQLMYGEGRFKGPLSVKVADEALSKRLTDGLYQVERDFSRLDARHPIGHLTLTYRDPAAGLAVEKQLTFHYDSYVVDVQIRTEGISGGLDVGLGTNFGIVEWGEGFIGLIGPAYLIDEELEKETPDEEAVHTGDVRWVALQDKYFMSVLIPTDAGGTVIRKEADKVVSAALRYSTAGAAALRLYAGPKQFDTLKGLNVGLEDTIDFGWFIYGSWEMVRLVAKPLFHALRFLNEFTHNYGLAIILLTICIKLVFVPLQYKSYKSMKDMQVIQPKVQELQKKLKDDRERLNKELIKLYRDHKVNPVGGCLPMLLQMPVFIALFNILYMTIDLRQAPLILWISDLSIPDPFYVLPVLMGASMVLQQRIMPTTMDPTQAKMMLLLPVFLTFVFLNFAAGLVLYWFTNNVLTIAQQFITDRYIFKKPTFSSLTGAGSGGGGGPSEGNGKRGAEEGTPGKANSSSAAQAIKEPAVATGQKGSGKKKKKKGKVPGVTPGPAVGGDGQQSSESGHRGSGDQKVLTDSDTAPLSSEKGANDASVLDDGEGSSEVEEETTEKPIGGKDRPVES